MRAGVSVPNSNTAAVGPIATGTAFWMHFAEQPRPDEMPAGPGSTFTATGRVANVPVREAVRPSASVALTAIRYVVFGWRPTRKSVRSVLSS